MRINKEQYDTLVAKLDALQTSTQRMASGFEQAPIAWNRQQDRLTAIEEGLKNIAAQMERNYVAAAKHLDMYELANRRSLDRIDQAQGVLCERLDGLARQIDGFRDEFNMQAGFEDNREQKMMKQLDALAKKSRKKP